MSGMAVPTFALDAPGALKRRLGRESVHDVFIELAGEGGGS